MNTTTIDIEGIKGKLPHRYPFLMIDRIEESGPGYAIGLKNVTVNEPFFQGHFPERSIMPGVMITEAILQTSAFMGNKATDGKQSVEQGRTGDKRYFCVGFNMKFQKVVVPGDQLRINVTFLRQVKGMTLVKSVVKVNSTPVATGELTLITVEEDAV